MSCPTRIGIYQPYTWDEPTRTACVVADHLQALGAAVSWLSRTVELGRVHSTWDARVRCERRQPYAEWLKRCSHLVWTDVYPTPLQRSVEQGKRNVLVLPWHRITEAQMSYLDLYDTVLCPSAACYRLLSKALDPTKLSAALFDVAEQQTPPSPSGQRRLFCPIDSYTARVAGVGLLHALGMLLDADDDASVTVAYGKNWSHEGLALLKGMAARHGERLKLVQRPSQLARAECYATHDLTCDLSLRQTTGLFSLESLAYGRPALVFDVAPMMEIVALGKTGWLVPCGVQYNWLRAPEAVINYAELYDALRQACADVAAGDMGVVKNYRTPRTARRKTFLASLRAALELP